MTNRSTIDWLGEMAFDVQLNGHHFTIDAGEKVGGSDKGPRPKGLMLSALAGCTGMDVVSILKKMKFTDYKLKISTEGILDEEFPKPYTKILTNFLFEGKNIPINKVKKAISLSEEKYCGVFDMLRKAAELETKIFINGEEI